MADLYARVAPDAFSDIRDVQLRNQRIQQDLLNQRRNFEAQQAAREFDEWQKAWDRKDYGYYNKDDVARVYGKQTPFVGQAPSISKGLEYLGITPEGKLTFGIHGSNLVSPLRNKPRKFRTDNNGNPIPLSDEEIALTEKASAEMNQQAASDAGQGEENREKPWYDFLKYPQNTPYEQEQMRNQGILRDAAIAAAMNKPVFYPEADTLSEPMAKLAGQQSSLAQSAMGQFTQRQGMAADMYKQVTNLANAYAAQSLQAQIKSQERKALSDQAARNAKIYEEQAAELYGKLPKDVQEAYGTPRFLEVVRSKEDKELFEKAQQYDALKRSQAMLENQALSENERANSYLAKANSFGEGVSNIDKNWDLGLGFGDVSNQPYKTLQTTQPVQFGGQGDVGRNEVSIATPSGFSVVGSVSSATSTPSASKTAPVAPANAIGGSGKGKLKFDPKTNSVYIVSSSEGSASEDPIAKRIARLSTGKDVDIARFAARGSRLNLDTGFQAAKDKAAWLTELSAVSNEIAKKPENVAKYRDFIYQVLKGGEGRFGNAATIFLTTPSLNVPMDTSLKFYKNDILAKNGEGRMTQLWNLYNRAEQGLGLTKQQLTDMENILTRNYTPKNYFGKTEKALLENNGLKLNYSPLIDPSTGKQAISKTGNKLYKLDLEDSFK